MIPAGLAALIPVGYIVYLALSKKTSLPIKRVSVGALILIVLAFVVCSILLFISGSPVVVEKGYTDLPLVPAEKGKDNSALLLALVIVLIFLIMVITISIREQRHLQENKKAGKNEENKKSTAGEGENRGQHNQ